MQPRKTPLTARSVVASALLGTDPPRLPARLLVRAAELFGIAEGTTRTALSRMVSAGELVVDGDQYRLTGALLGRQARQAASRRADTRDWDGTWEVAVVRPDPRPAADRSALRTSMAALRFAELREGVWLRPDNLEPDRSSEAAAIAKAQCTWLRGARPDTALEQLWDLRSWAAGAGDLREELARLLPALEAGRPDALAEGFETSAAVLRHLQADPLLPAALLPTGWPGTELRTEYDRYDAAYRAALRSWFRAQR